MITKADELLRLSGAALAEYPDDQPDRVHVRHDTSPNQALAGLPIEEQHAPHDVQTGHVRRREKEETTGL